MQTEDLASLQEQANLLKERLEAIKRDYQTQLSADSEERAVELENRETLQEIERVTREQLNTINDKIAAHKLSK